MLFVAHAPSFDAELRFREPGEPDMGLADTCDTLQRGILGVPSGHKIERLKLPEPKV